MRVGVFYIARLSLEFVIAPCLNVIARVIHLVLHETIADFGDDPNNRSEAGVVPNISRLVPTVPGMADSCNIRLRDSLD